MNGWREDVTMQCSREGEGVSWYVAEDLLVLILSDD